MALPDWHPRADAVRIQQESAAQLAALTGSKFKLKGKSNIALSYIYEIQDKYSGLAPSVMLHGGIGNVSMTVRFAEKVSDEIKADIDRMNKELMMRTKRLCSSCGLDDLPTDKTNYGSRARLDYLCALCYEHIPGVFVGLNGKTNLPEPKEVTIAIRDDVDAMIVRKPTMEQRAGGFIIIGLLVVIVSALGYFVVYPGVTGIVNWVNSIIQGMTHHGPTLPESTQDKTWKLVSDGIILWGIYALVMYGILSIFGLSRRLKIILSILTPLAIVIYIAFSILRGFMPHKEEEYVVVRRV